MTERNNFYEDDEPIKEILAAWKRGKKSFTSPPVELARTRGDWTLSPLPYRRDSRLRLHRKSATAA